MRRRTYTEDFKRCAVDRVRAVAAELGVNYNTLWRWCQELGVSARRLTQDAKPSVERPSGERTELHVWVPSNRIGDDGLPTHMDGWNEILEQYKKNRHKGAKAELANVEYVASYVEEAMDRQGWHPMENKRDAMPCKVEIEFVERDKRRDLGNIHGGAKYALDALTHRHQRGASAIFDDSQKWLVDVSYAVSVDQNSPGMQITVQAVDARTRRR